MTQNKRYLRFIDNYEDVYIETPTGQKIEIGWEDDVSVDSIDEVVDLLNEKEETIKKQNQEILSCHDTLVTIEALCDAVLNYDFKNVTDKVDFCHMLNEMDNKDLMFLKECFEAIKNNDLKQMTSLTVECMGDVND